jgi:hypothetical protein
VVAQTTATPDSNVSEDRGFWKIQVWDWTCRLQASRLRSCTRLRLTKSRTTSTPRLPLTIPNMVRICDAGLGLWQAGLYSLEWRQYIRPLHPHVGSQVRYKLPRSKHQMSTSSCSIDTYTVQLLDTIYCTIYTKASTSMAHPKDAHPGTQMTTTRLSRLG